MFRTTILTAAAAFAITTAATAVDTTPARAGIGATLDLLDEFDDLTGDAPNTCYHIVRRVKVKVHTKHGYKWVWVNRREEVCDDD